MNKLFIRIVMDFMIFIYQMPSAIEFI